MRKVILAVLVLVSVHAFGQNPTNYLLRSTRERLISSMVDSMLRIPRYCGVPSGVRVSEVSTIDGALAMDTCNNRLYMFSGNAWVKIANYLDLGTGSVDSIWRVVGKDSIFYSKNGNTYKIKDSTGAYRFGKSGEDDIALEDRSFTLNEHTFAWPDLEDFSDTVTWKPMVVSVDNGQMRKATYWPGSGGSQTWQQTLIAGSTLTGANTINGGDYNFTFGQMGLFTISQNNKSSVSGSNGTANVSPLTVTGGNGGSTSYSTGTVSGGNAGAINITGGNGGGITGTPATGVGGTGSTINITAGDGGLGTTFGGTAGNVEIAAGVGGGGTSGGAAGYVAIKGGFAGSTGNADGGNVYVSPGAKNGSGADGHIFLGLSPSNTVRGSATIGSATKGDSLFNIKSGGLYADRGVRFPNIPSGTKSDSLMVKNSTGTVKYINTSDFTFQQDTISLASFGAGGGQSGDTTSFSTSTIYGSFYNDGSDTLVITSIRAVLQGSSPSLVPTVYYNDSINVTAGATKLVNSPSALTNTAVGVSSTPDNKKIPPGVWVWVKTETVTTKPTYFSLTLIGYKKRK